MNGHKNILIVDDEKDLTDLIAINLEKSGYQTSVALNGRQALAAIAAAPPDLILLDLMLPEVSGIEVARRIRTDPATADIPIIMLTAKGTENDQLAGLTMGADDYIAKPFSMRVLLARIEAVLRRTAKPAASKKLFSLGSIQLSTDTHQATVDGQPMRLTLTEFRLLCALIQAAGRILSRPVLMQRAMGPGVTVTERTIDVHVTSIRKKLGPHSAMIKTVRGVGYRMTESAETDDLIEAESSPNL
ncbi:MAG: response regulator [Phycisphaeraceae bacterium]|nr:response regulator [Phycisphaerae bacterium]MBX3392203.1 response regulator [Phycisphaeraceae bacterium]